MRFVTYRTVETEPRLGLVHDDLVIDVEVFGDAIGHDLPSTMLDFIDLGPIAVRFLHDAVAKATPADLVGTSLPTDNVTLLAPIPRPRKNIFGIGLNYTEHVAESARSLDQSKDLPQQPIILSKPPTAVVGRSEESRLGK